MKFPLISLVLCLAVSVAVLSLPAAAHTISFVSLSAQAQAGSAPATSSGDQTANSPLTGNANAEQRATANTAPINNGGGWGLWGLVGLLGLLGLGGGRRHESVRRFEDRDRDPDIRRVA
jgi:MYXO-CTERM domain-containing protein